MPKRPNVTIALEEFSVFLCTRNDPRDDVTVAHVSIISARKRGIAARGEGNLNVNLAVPTFSRVKG
jgi:hypothetical protein